MAELANATLLQDVKVFGHRVFEFTTALEGDAALAEKLRRAASEAPRRLTRAAAAGEDRVALRERLCAFKALSEAVECLDRIPREGRALAIDASALAQEGAELCGQVYDLVA
jgi:hypothetical protein